MEVSYFVLCVLLLHSVQGISISSKLDFDSSESTNISTKTTGEVGLVGVKLREFDDTDPDESKVLTASIPVIITQERKKPVTKHRVKFYKGVGVNTEDTSIEVSPTTKPSTTSTTTAKSIPIIKGSYAGVRRDFIVPVASTTKLDLMKVKNYYLTKYHEQDWNSDILSNNIPAPSSSSSTSSLQSGWNCRGSQKCIGSSDNWNTQRPYIPYGANTNNWGQNQRPYNKPYYPQDPYNPDQNRPHPNGGYNPPQGGNNPYPGSNNQYPGNNNPYPGNSNPYPGNNNPYPGNNNPYPSQSNPGQWGCGVYPNVGPNSNLNRPPRESSGSRRTWISCRPFEVGSGTKLLCPERGGVDDTPYVSKIDDKIDYSQQRSSEEM